MDRRFYVYVLFLKGASAPFYVGKGCGDRMLSHLREEEMWDGRHFRIMPNGDKEWANEEKLKIIRENREDVVASKVLEGLTEQEAFEWEKVIISVYGIISEGGVLTNKTLGGDGVTMTAEVRQKISEALKGQKHTDDWKKRMSVFFSGANNPFYGKKHSPEAIEANRRAHLGENNACYGTKQTEESNLKRSLATSGEKHYMWGKKTPEEVKAKISASSRGKEKPKIACHKCGGLFAANTLKRWHGENCKV